MRTSKWLPGVVLALIIGFTASSGVISGPLFDDYLNYARLGERVMPSAEETAVTSDQPIGQTFRVAPGTGEIYRIGIFANSNPDSWGEGEIVTLTLYDSPAKGRTLASYEIDWRTCRIQGIRHREQDRILLFHLRADVTNETSLYFELTVRGGDGNVRFRYLPDGGYDGGQGYRAGQPQNWDLGFETHIKLDTPPEENLEDFFNNRIDLNHPPLAAVKSAVESRNWELAIEELVKHFRSRTELYEPSIFEPSIDPDFNSTHADIFLEGNLWKVDLEGQLHIIPWRTESYWAPDHPQFGKDLEPWIYGWQMERTLWGAYSMTGDPKYAEKGMEYRIQWVLDNVPAPQVSGIDYPHQVWSELTAAGRGPGHLAYVYSRVYNYDGFTNDQLLIYFMNWYDNAFSLLDTDVGGNWLMQAADAAYSFGKRFPEFREKDRFITWGVENLIKVSLETVRGDGTQHEAAVKYHAMVARRLKGLMEDYLANRVALDPAVAEQLRVNLAGMYTYMAHTLQPNSHVVMTGNSWYEDFSNEVAEVGRILDRPDLVWIATQGRQGMHPGMASTAFPDGGYFHMRSDFGGPGLDFTDARQLVVHNGGWIGSHGHFDLLSFNIYAFGRTLIVDPGGMWNPPDGSPPYYWKSDIHSMLVANRWDLTRDPGTTKWVASKNFDYLDGNHYGYANRGIPEVRRRLVFLKPDYWVVDDSASVIENEYNWDQVWNFLASDVKVDPVTKVAETQFPSGGNIIIHPVGEADFSVEEREAHAPIPEGAFQDTTILYFGKRTNNPRFTTVIYPYKDNRPALEVRHMAPDGSHSDMITGVWIGHDNGADAVIWGDVNADQISFEGGSHITKADVFVVRTRDGRNVNSFQWFNGQRAVFNGLELARADHPIAMLDVTYANGTVDVQLREPTPGLVIWIGQATKVTVNGEELQNIRPYQGYLRLFPDMPKSIVVDVLSPGFKRTSDWPREWATVSDPSAYNHHYDSMLAMNKRRRVPDDDPNRYESAVYSTNIPQSGRYKLEAYIPETTRTKSDGIHYIVRAFAGGQNNPANLGGHIVNRTVDETSGTYTVVVNQQGLDQWVDLGTYYFAQGEREFLKVINANMAVMQWPIFDAIRLTPVQ